MPVPQTGFATRLDMRFGNLDSLLDSHRYGMFGCLDSWFDNHSHEAVAAAVAASRNRQTRFSWTWLAVVCGYRLINETNIRKICTTSVHPAHTHRIYWGGRDEVIDNGSGEPIWG